MDNLILLENPLIHKTFRLSHAIKVNQQLFIKHTDKQTDRQTSTHTSPPTVVKWKGHIKRDG